VETDLGREQRSTGGGAAGRGHSTALIFIVIFASHTLPLSPDTSRPPLTSVPVRCSGIGTSIVPSFREIRLRLN